MEKRHSNSHKTKNIPGREKLYLLSVDVFLSLCLRWLKALTVTRVVTIAEDLHKKAIC